MLTLMLQMCILVLFFTRHLSKFRVHQTIQNPGHKYCSKMEIHDIRLKMMTQQLRKANHDAIKIRHDAVKRP